MRPIHYKILAVVLFVILLHSIIGINVEGQSNIPINHLDELCIVIDQNSNTSGPICISIGKELILSNNSETLKYRAYGYYGVGLGEFMAQNFTKSQLYLDSALTLFQQLEDSIKIQRILNRLGNINHILGNDKLAFLKYQQSFKIALMLGDESRIADLQNNLGLVCYRQKDYAQAEEYYNKAIDGYSKLNDKQSTADVYYNLAMVLNKKEQFDASKKLLEKCIEIYDKFNDLNSKASALFVMGEIYESKNGVASSDEYYMLSYKLFQATSDSMNMLPCLIKLSYRAIRSKEFELAKDLIEQFKLVNKKIADLDGDEEVLKLQYIFHKEIGQYETSLFYLEELNKVRAEISQQEDKIRLTEVREEFQSELQKQELFKSKENDRLKSIILFALIILIITLLSTLLFYFRHLKAKQKQRVLMLEQKVLRTQMDPHFLFNSISAIQFYIMDDKPQEAIRFLGDFSALLRMVLQYSKDEFISIEKEVKLTEYYIELHTRRYENKVKLNLIIDPAINQVNTMLPPMLTQPLLESFLERNKSTNEELHQILVSYQIKGDELMVIVEDNFHSEQEEFKPSVLHQNAILNTKERLELIRSIKNFEIKFSITGFNSNLKKGTKATFIIPI